MDTCPHCHRRLLSHISIRCNWCGAEIEDPAYLAQAEVERAAARAEDALHSLQSRMILVNAPTSAPFAILPEDAVTRLGRLEFEALEQARRETLHRVKQQKAAEETPVEGPATEAHDRFGHLEL